MMNHLFKAGARFFFYIAMIFTAAACSSDKAPTSAEEPREIYTIINTFVGTGEAGKGADGLAPLQTMLYLPQDLTFGPDGKPYILDWNNHRVRIIDGDAVRTLIGTGELGDASAGQALEIGLNHPTHIAFDPQGRLILSAWHNSKVLRMDLTTGFIEPICGDGTRAYRGDGGSLMEAWGVILRGAAWARVDANMHSRGKSLKVHNSPSFLPHLVAMESHNTQHASTFQIQTWMACSLL